MKTAREVNKDMLAKCVANVESEGGVEGGLSNLYKQVADMYNGLIIGQVDLPRITPSIAMLRIKEFGVAVKTQMGRRGRQKGAGPVNRVAAKKRFANNPSFEQVKAELKADPYIKESVALAILDGSRSAGVKGKCLECCGGYTQEIKNCTSYGCGLWLFRPYQDGVPADPEEMLTKGPGE